MQRQLRVTVDGHVYEVTVEDLTDTGNQLYPAPNTMSAHNVMTPPPAAPVSAPAAPPPPAESPAPAGAGAVTSPMSGVLAELMVKVGQQVNPGDTVASIEAMKMKTPLVVDHGGTVASIDVAVGGPVQSGQTILTLS